MSNTFATIPDWLIFTFAMVGATSVAAGIAVGIGFLIGRIVNWARKTNDRIIVLWDELKILWQAVDDINKRLGDAEEETES